MSMGRVQLIRTMFVLLYIIVIKFYYCYVAHLVEHYLDLIKRKNTVVLEIESWVLILCWYITGSFCDLYILYFCMMSSGNLI